MLETTFQIMKSGMRGDPTLSPKDRARILAYLRNGTSKEKIESDQSSRDRIRRIVRRREAADMLSCSLRLIDRLAKQGVLKKVRLPGRQRGAGFLESDVLAVIAAGKTP
jgi:hypothetical protein